MISDTDLDSREMPGSSAGIGTAEDNSSVCWNCGSANYEQLYQAPDFDTALDSYPIRRCRQCDLCYTGAVTDDLLASIYSRSYYGSGNAKFLSAIEKLVKFGHRRQAKKILGLYRDQQPGSVGTGQSVSVLDIGCGRALLLQEFDRLGADCLGIERAEFPGSERHGIAIHTGALHDRELSGKRFDIIVLWHVLEHITELGTLLEALPGHLNPGGLLVVSVPNFSSWQSRFFKRHWFHLDIPRHVTHFDRDWLKDKFDTMGLEVISENTFTASQNTYGFIQSSLNRIFPRKPNRFYKLLTQGQGRRNLAALAGWSLLAIPLLLCAVLESLVAETTHQGATLTLYARKRIRASEAGSGNSTEK